MPKSHPLQRAQIGLILLAGAAGFLTYLIWAVSGSVADARRLERRRRGEYGRLAEQYDELAQDTLAIITARDSWLRLSIPEQREVLFQLCDEVNKRENPGDEHVAAAAAPITIDWDEVRRLEKSRRLSPVEHPHADWPDRRASVVLSQAPDELTGGAAQLGDLDEAWQPDPGTIEECPGTCTSPAACHTEGHCRLQLPEPTRNAEDCGPECAQAWADAAAERAAERVAEHGGAGPGYTTGDDR